MLRNNNSLTRVVLRNNKLKPKHGTMIAKAISNNTKLQALSLYVNDILHDPKCVKFWRGMLSTNNTLEQLDFSVERRTVSYEGHVHIFEGVAENQRLQCLTIQVE